MLWLSILFLVFLGIDIWNRPKTKHRTRNAWFIVFESLLAVSFILGWLYQKIF